MIIFIALCLVLTGILVWYFSLLGTEPSKKIHNHPNQIQELDQKIKAAVDTTALGSVTIESTNWELKVNTESFNFDKVLADAVKTALLRHEELRKKVLHPKYCTAALQNLAQKSLVKEFLLTDSIYLNRGDVSLNPSLNCLDAFTSEEAKIFFEEFKKILDDKEIKSQIGQFYDTINVDRTSFAAYRARIMGE